MSKEIIAKLRAEVDASVGRARLAPLTRLGQALMADFVDVGPGAPGAVLLLDGSIEVLTEALDLTDASDPLRDASPCCSACS